MTTASIVTYRTPLAEIDKVLHCLRHDSVSKVFVVDNARDSELARHLAGDSFVEYIPADNRGYGAGHNIGIRRAREAGAEYHIVMNSDIYWEGSQIARCLEYMDANIDAGQLMPKIVYPDGRLQHQCKLIPTLADLLFRRFIPAKARRTRTRRYQLEFTGYDHVMNVPYLCGCFMLFRMSALDEVGLFDERFFMYPEDIDMTRRMHERYRTVYYPDACITHIYAVSSRKNLRMFGIHAWNMIKYFCKWGWIFDSGRKRYNRRLLESEAALGHRP